MSSQQSVSSGVAISSPLRPSGPFGRFAERLLALELPDLPDARRIETVEFVCRRSDQVPTPLRAGVIGLTFGVGVGQRVLGEDRTTHLLRNTSLPFVGELARLVRSLGFAYIWETWPSTSPSGAPG